MAEADMHTLYTCYALFLFSPRYTRENPKRVQAWVDRLAALTPERDVALQRIDMIMAHDVLARLGDIRRPTLVISGDSDFCTPPHLSEELVHGIPGAQRVLLPGGHLIHDEDEQGFSDAVRAFIDAQ